ncbi:MAG: DUF1624 domain-containing protein [Candidatus Heimdallarchaeota archaeon]
MNVISEKQARPLGLTLLVGYNLLTGILMFLILLLVVIQSWDSFVNLIINQLIFPVSVVGSFLLAYGLWMRRNWAWWLSIILALIGLVVFWINIPVVILVLLDLSLEENVLAAILIVVSYIANFIIIIFYLTRSHVKAIFNVKPIAKPSQNPVQNPTQTRLPFIDFARGIVMVLMAWDHVSVFWNPGRRGSEGLLMLPDGVATLFRPEFPNFTQFLLRFITHWCAPTFIFLAGTALALSTVKRLARGESQRDVTLQIIKRSAVLLFFEAFIIAPAFFYNLPPHLPTPYLYFGVIACIAICFIIFSVLRRIPPIAILGFSIFIIIGQPFFKLDWLWNILIRLGMGDGFRWYLKVILFQPNFEWWPYVGLYPIIPWIGVMGLGWCFGIFLTSYNREKIKRLVFPITAIGGAALVLWFVVRLLKGYGNRLPRLGNTDNTIQDWLFMAKYPPSIAFLLWTLGGMCFFLALGLILQKRPNFTRGITGVIYTFGKVPLFFYVIHILLYKFWVSWFDRPTSFQTNLVGTAIFWVVGLIILWRLCIWYQKFKKHHPDSLLKYI